MSDDVRAAAERAVRWYESMRRYGGRWDALADDIVQSARAVLAEHPADDGEPVTDEWLESIGHPTPPEPPQRGGHRWMVLVVDGKGSSYRLPNAATRGDVRRLCRALGVTLRGPVAEISESFEPVTLTDAEAEQMDRMTQRREGGAG